MTTTAETHRAIAQMRVLMTQAADRIFRYATDLGESHAVDGIVKDLDVLTAIKSDADLIDHLRAAALPWDQRHKLADQPAPVAPDLVSVPDDMIKWPGGDCPVPGDTEVVVKFRGGGTSGGDAGGYDWSHCGGKTLATADIVAYRVATATPQAPKEKQT